MIPTLLITLREVIEASLIVATVLGVLIKLGKTKSVKAVWVASLLALAASFLFVFAGSLVGIQIRQWIESPVVEISLPIISAFFVTWAVFSLHKQFARDKMIFLSHVNETAKRDGIFLFTFFSVFREGIEIVFFLSTIYLTSDPVSIMNGFLAGVVGGICVSMLFFSATVHMPVYWAFRTTNYLLILFAGKLLSQGVAEIHIHSVGTLPLIAGLTYIFLMHRQVFVRSRYSTQAPEARDRGSLSARVNRY